MILVMAISIFSLSESRCLNAATNYLRGFPIHGGGIELPPFQPGNRAELLVNGNEILPALLDNIARSERIIRIQVMLFHPDDAGNTLTEALVEAAGRGVIVQLSFDVGQTSYGSPLGSILPWKRLDGFEPAQQMLTQLEAAGAEVLDNPPGVGESKEGLSPEASAAIQSMSNATCIDFNHVDHRKVFIFDDSMAIVGGTNVGNEYLYLEPPNLSLTMQEEARARDQNGDTESWEKWLDTALLIEGPAVDELVREFNTRWEGLGGVPVPLSQATQASGEYAAQILPQRPGHEAIAKSLMSLIEKAEDQIYISSPYVSYRPALDALMDAAQRDVKVVFIYPGSQNDVGISRRILRALTQELISAGIHVYENNDRMIHSKVVVVDGRWVMMGSSNLNYRSLKHDFEQNVLIDSEAFADTVIRRVFNGYIDISDLLTEPYPIRLNLLERIAVPFT